MPMGFTHSEQTKNKISIANTGKRRTEEYKKKMSLLRTGHKDSDATKQKKSLALMGNKRKLGHLASETTRRKIGEAHAGNKHWNWRGGYENKLMLNRKRRIMKVGNGGAHTLEQWEALKERYNWTCPACKISEPEIKLTEDHIVAVKNGGSDNIDNIQPLCKSCNSRKQTQTIFFREISYIP